MQQFTEVTDVYKPELQCSCSPFTFNRVSVHFCVPWFVKCQLQLALISVMVPFSLPIKHFVYKLHRQLVTTWRHCGTLEQVAVFPAGNSVPPSLKEEKLLRCQWWRLRGEQDQVVSNFTDSLTVKDSSGLRFRLRGPEESNSSLMNPHPENR